jgi:hypothetical protein
VGARRPEPLLSALREFAQRLQHLHAGGVQHRLRPVRQCQIAPQRWIERAQLQALNTSSVSGVRSASRSSTTGSRCTSTLVEVPSRTLPAQFDSVNPQPGSCATVCTQQ